MKVLFASHLFPNPNAPVFGAFVAELAGALSAYADLSVAAPVSWFPFVRPCAGIPAKRWMGNVVVHHPRQLAMPSPLGGSRWICYLRALSAARPAGPWDVIHSHWIYPDAFAVTRWKEAKGAKRVATVHGHAALGLGMVGRDSSRIPEALHRMDHVVTVSGELKSILLERFGVSPERVSVLDNGIDPRAFHWRDRKAARRRLGLPLERPLVLTVARLSPEKCHKRLVDAVAACPRKDFEVRLVGNGPEIGRVAAAIERTGLQDRVFLQGNIARDVLPDWYAAADLFCLMSAHEGRPVVIREALAAGLPVVSTRVGAVPDMVGPAEGILCEPGDAGALAGALQRGLEHSWDREAIARSGARYTWDAVARQLADLYRRLGTEPSVSGEQEHRTPRHGRVSSG